jgi:putative transposase
MELSQKRPMGKLAEADSVISMPRPLRIHLDHGFYHVTLRGNHQQAIFGADSDRYLLNAIVGRSLHRYQARLHAYCWMTNHLHFLIQVGESPLGAVMRQVAAGYARAFQQKLETRGHLFERRYHARLVADDSYLLALLRYIHLNPVQAHMVAQPSDYPWSSHAAYCGGRCEPWLFTDFALALFAPDRPQAQAAYRRFMAEGDPEWTPAPEETPLESSLRMDAKTTRAPGLIVVPRAQTLDDLIAEACDRFGIGPCDLTSPGRDAIVVRARGWVSREALSLRVSTLSEVARALGRDRATLRYAIRRLEAEGAG